MNNVKIAMLGYPPPCFPGEDRFPDYTPDYDELCEKMISYWKEKISFVLPDRPDMIVLPEMCDRFKTSGRVPAECMSILREKLHHSMPQILQDIANKNKCYIVHACALPAGENLWFNSAVVIDRDGKIIAKYNKNYTVISEIESDILCGRSPVVVDCDFGRVGILICFDLNFDALRLQYKNLKPDVLVFPSNYHGGLMQPYWAYSCGAHFVGCMGSGCLPSEVYSPVGHLLASSTNYYSHIVTTLNLDCQTVHLDFNQDKLRKLKIKYMDNVDIFDPGKLGSVLVSSKSLEVSAKEMLSEFEIVVLDDYLALSIQSRNDLLAASVREMGDTVEAVKAVENGEL